jgi:hypothetical protein
MPTHPKAFLMYSWGDDEHQRWVLNLATQLRDDGIEARLDEWHSVPGDHLPHFMEREVQSADFVIIICTPKYKTKFDNRDSGVGYEANLVTAEIAAKQNHRKFITILARGTWAESLPSVFSGKKSIDFSDALKRQKNYSQLLGAILGTYPQPPPLGQRRMDSKQRPSAKPPVPSRPMNQMRSAIPQVSLQLYDRRLPVYKAAQRLIDYIMTKGDCTTEELGKLGAVIPESRHLFNEDIENYLRTLHREATAVSLGKQKQQRMADQPANEEYRSSLNAFM